MMRRALLACAAMPARSSLLARHSGATTLASNNDDEKTVVAFVKQRQRRQSGQAEAPPLTFDVVTNNAHGPQPALLRPLRRALSSWATGGGGGGSGGDVTAAEKRRKKEKEEKEEEVEERVEKESHLCGLEKFDDEETGPPRSAKPKPRPLFHKKKNAGEHAGATTKATPSIPTAPTTRGGAGQRLNPVDA